jgi:hypothetical protein
MELMNCYFGLCWMFPWYFVGVDMNVKEFKWKDVGYSHVIL